MSNKIKIYIIDFEDSFTFNIANVLYPFCNELQVLNFKSFFEDHFDNINSQNNIAIILGPGPGHPTQYTKYFKQVKILLSNNNIYLMGICLGHQMISLQFDYEIISSLNPLHGERIPLMEVNQHYYVQRYNSLAIIPKNKPNEISYMHELMDLVYRNGRSYQFHPESIGTENSIYFFKDLLKFIGAL